MKSFEDAIKTSHPEKGKYGLDVNAVSDSIISVKSITDRGVHIIVHPLGKNGDTHDFMVNGNTIEPMFQEGIDRNFIFDALGKICERIEACGASTKLTDAVSLASDLRQAIGNQYNPECEFALKRVKSSLLGKDKNLGNHMKLLDAKNLRALLDIAIDKAEGNEESDVVLTGYADKMYQEALSELDQAIAESKE